MNKTLSMFLAGVSFLAAASFSQVSAASIDVSGNGAFSDNAVRYNSTSSTNVHQTNNTDISNNVNVNNNTGHNTASGNTGGDVSIQTGDANSDVHISNTAGMNVANINGNNSNNHSDVVVSGNGAFSDNRVNLSERNSTTVDQTNNTNIDNNVNVRNNTGYNTANGNTGFPFFSPRFSGYDNGGNTSIETGNANSNVSITNKAGVNEAGVSGNSNHDTYIETSGNGAYSRNSVNAYSNDTKRVNQDNYTDFNNHVNVHDNTGYNNAENHDNYPSFQYKDDKMHRNNYIPVYKLSDYHDSRELPYVFSDYHKKDNKDCDDRKYYPVSIRYEKEPLYCLNKFYPKVSMNKNHEDFDHNKNNYSDSNRFYGKNHFPYFMGNNGNVSIKTGNANSHVALANTGSANYFNH